MTSTATASVPTPAWPVHEQHGTVHHDDDDMTYPYVTTDGTGCFDAAADVPAGFSKRATEADDPWSPDSAHVVAGSNASPRTHGRYQHQHGDGAAPLAVHDPTAAAILFPGDDMDDPDCAGDGQHCDPTSICVPEAADRSVPATRAPTPPMSICAALCDELHCGDGTPPPPNGSIITITLPGDIADHVVFMHHAVFTPPPPTRMLLGHPPAAPMPIDALLNHNTTSYNFFTAFAFITTTSDGDD